MSLAKCPSCGRDDSAAHLAGAETGAETSPNDTRGDRALDAWMHAQIDAGRQAITLEEQGEWWLGYYHARRKARLDLVGMTEIAERAGVAYATVKQWRVRYPDTFPSPTADLAVGPVWRWTDIEAWLGAREIRKPGPKPRHGQPADASQ